jgi:hypothetical protein
MASTLATFNLVNMSMSIKVSATFTMLVENLFFYHKVFE